MVRFSLLPCALALCCHCPVDGLAPPSLRAKPASRAHPPRSAGLVCCNPRSAAGRWSLRPTSSLLMSDASAEADGGSDASDAGAVSKELDIDGTISSWQRLVSALPKLKYSRSAPPDELDKKILSTALPTMLNLMVVPLGE